MRKIRPTDFLAVAAVIVAITLITVNNLAANTAGQLLNVSYDPTRELYRSLNDQFVPLYKRRPAGICASGSRTAGPPVRRGR